MIRETLKIYGVTAPTCNCVDSTSAGNEVTCACNSVEAVNTNWIEFAGYFAFIIYIDMAQVKWFAYWSVSAFPSCLDWYNAPKIL